MIKIAVPGVNGRMGNAIAAAALNDPDVRLSLATVRTRNPMVGELFSYSNLVINTDDALDSSEYDVLIDFTLPAGLMVHLDYCIVNNRALVIGSTGLDQEQLRAIKEASEFIPILYSPNMSVGVNITYKLLAYAAQLMDKNWDAKIHDIHHQHKKDAPSGTAKAMLQYLEQANSQQKIQVTSERTGDVVGEHYVTFSGPGEEIQINHIAHNRSIFALGAVTAAKWLYGKGNGLYSMQDVV